MEEKEEKKQRSMIDDYIQKNRNKIDLGQAIIFVSEIYNKKGFDKALDYLETKLPAIAKKLESGIFNISSCPSHTHQLIHELASSLQNTKLKSVPTTAATTTTSDEETKPKRL